MLQNQLPQTIDIITDNPINEDKLLSLKALANAAGMAAMGHLVQHFYFDPLRAARDAEEAPDLDQRNAVDEAQRRDVFGRTVEDHNRVMQGFTPSRPRFEIATDWLSVRRACLETMLPMNPGRYDEPMNTGLLFEYTVKKYATSSLGQARAAALALGSLVDVDAAEERAIQAAAIRFAAVQDDCISTFDNLDNEIQEPSFGAFENLEPTDWIATTIKVADKICQDALRMEHNTASFLQQFAGRIATRLDTVDRLMQEADRLVHENEAAVIEATSRNWRIPGLTELRITELDRTVPSGKKMVHYDCQKRLDTWRKAQQLRAAA